ncbi:MAG TPA: 3'-5' exonuclease, partial [Gammaproteobacteria bacterium]|nr:3'-5' exonuclease [Gammaproteobacteria bacterium]
LSADGRRRLERLRGKLAGAEENRARFPFAAWIEHVWRALDGPASLDAPDEQVYAREYFARLERIARRGDLDDPAALEEAFTKPAAGAESPANTAVEIMTIHRAKGLEFDTVILLGLGREPRREPRKALHFMQRVARDGAEDLIIAPLPRLGEDDALCNFVARAEGSREQAERTRLLYVAATRARERLHLVCRIRPDRDEPAPRTLLSRFWTQVEGRFEGVSEPEAREARAAAERFRPVLRRFADGLEADGVESEHTRPSRSRRPAFEWAGQPAIQVGTLVHAYLHRIAESGLEAWSSTRVSASRELFVRELAVLGLDAEELEPAAERVAEALCGVLGDVRGRWLLESHPEARSELRLSLRGGAALEHVQLDRTFVAEGVRWIVDFKTSAHEGGNIETFLDSEVQRYRAQLERYARTMAAIDPRPQRVGLYFPLLRAFRSWCPECKRNA